MFAFYSLLAALATTALCQSTLDNVQKLTQKSQALQSTADSITLVNSALFPIGQGPVPKIIDGLNDIAASADAYTDQLTAVEDENEANDIYTAYAGFSQVYIKLVNTIASKRNIITIIPTVSTPIVNSLNANNEAIINLSYGLIANAPSRASNFAIQMVAITDALSAATKAYSVLSK